MNLRDFSLILSKEVHMSVDDVHRVLTKAFDTLVDVAKDGDEIRVNDIGKFYLLRKPARSIVNNATGKLCNIPAHYQFKFREFPKLRERLTNI